MRQAVVLIHGIGEQKPMDTLRRFVSAVLPPAQPDPAPFWNKPDTIAELFELRRLKTKGWPNTDFYEYYWAYHVEGTKLMHLLEWVWELIRRPKREIPITLRGVWGASRILLGLLLVTALLGSVGHVLGWYADIPASGLIWLAISAALGLAQYFLIYYVGDAARYLSPQPGNIKMRQEIRAEGVKLLRKLHESDKYDRILVVGHSLGSVIGYDIMTRLWQEYNGIYSGFTADNETLHSLLSNGKPPQPILRKDLPTAGEALREGDAATFDAWRDCQRKAWLEQRRWGNPWRISDFITLGCPLAHAMLLLATSREDFDQRKRQRELPTCPPQRDKKGYGYVVKKAYNIMDKRFSSICLHHAALFAVTRWTNLYFPVKAGLGGDFIGGPLGPVMGLGIKDVPVQCPELSTLYNRSPLSHTAYWHDETTASAPTPEQDDARRESSDLDDRTSDTASPKAPAPALAALREALNLNELDRYHVIPEAAPRVPADREAEDLRTIHRDGLQPVYDDGHRDAA